MRSTASAILVLALLSAVPAAAVAETLRTPERQAQENGVSPGVPQRGMEMEEVQRRYGEPSRKLAPVGDPPITRWKYPGFTVYFEGRYVIHAVAAESREGRRQP